MKQYVWMKVSKDEYELPLEIADTAAELARKCGVNRTTVEADAGRVRKGTLKHSQYIRVYTGEIEETR